MDIVTCPSCKMKVLPKRDGTCPSCQAVISKVVSGSAQPQDSEENPPVETATPPKVNKLLGPASPATSNLPFFGRALARALKGFGIGVLIVGAILVLSVFSGHPVAISGGEILSLFLAAGLFCAIIGFCSTRPDPVNFKLSILLVAAGVIINSVGVYLYGLATGTNNKPADIITMTVILALLTTIWCSVEQVSIHPKK
jgi:hypothetical protein